jgi:RNA polymerase sigma factor (sigma-70 family)
METAESAFENLIDKNKSIIYTVCYMYSEHSEELNDLFQQIISCLWAGFSTVDGHSYTRSWIYRVSLNTCIAVNRRRLRNKRTAPLSMTINLFEDKDEEALHIGMLYSRIHQLKSLDRAIVLLCLENFSRDEISNVIGISTENISVRLDRLLEQMKKVPGYRNHAEKESGNEQGALENADILEQMQAQLSVLKKTLDGQDIVNDTILHKAMKRKVNNINRFVWGDITWLPLLILLLVFVVGNDDSIWLSIYLSVIVIADVFVDVKVSMISPLELVEDNIVDMGRKLKRLKRHHVIQVLGEFPCFLIFLFWLGYERMQQHTDLLDVIFTPVCGAVLGVALSYHTIREMKRTTNEMIQQVDELAKEQS